MSPTFLISASSSTTHACDTQLRKKRKYLAISSTSEDLINDAEVEDPKLVVSPLPQFDGPTNTPVTPPAYSLDFQATPTPCELVNVVGAHGPVSPAQEDRDANSVRDEQAPNITWHDVVLEIDRFCARLTSGLSSPAELHENHGDDMDEKCEEDEEDDDHLSDLINLLQRQKSRKDRH